MDIDIRSKEDVLCVCTAEQMRKTALQALKDAAAAKMSAFYMSFTKPASFVLSEMAKMKIPKENTLIIDCSGNKEGKQYDTVITIDATEHLTKMSIAAFDFVDMPGKKLFIIDAINVLANHNRVEDVSKMLQNIIQKDDEEQTKMLVFCTDAKSEKLIAQVEPFFDKVMRS